MRLRNIPGSREVIGESEFVVHSPESSAGKWAEIFGNNNPIRIEIGMGKGRFIICMPEEPHKPGIAAVENLYLKKCVFKIAVN